MFNRSNYQTKKRLERTISLGIVRYLVKFLSSTLQLFRAICVLIAKTKRL